MTAPTHIRRQGRLAESSPLALALVLALAAPAGGCLDAGQNPGNSIAPMCTTSADCDPGETCDQGVCWGNPPTSTQFGAILVPPDSRSDLALTEIPELAIAQDGTTTGLTFAKTALVSGRVVLICRQGDSYDGCGEDTSIAARIQIERPARIPGGPNFVRTVVAQAGVAPGGTAFSFRLPVSLPNEAPYTITVLPGGGTEAPDESAAAFAPPTQLSLRANVDSPDVEWTVGDPSQHKLVTGRVVDATGHGLPGMQVTALGRWNDGGPLQQASSVGLTDSSGNFSLRIPIAMSDVVDLVAKPAPGTVAPTLRVYSIDIPDPPVGQTGDTTPIPLADLVMPSYPAPSPYVLPVKGADSSGGMEPVPGAEVQVSTTLASAPGTSAVFTTTGVTDPSGDASLMLLPGGTQNRSYDAEVIPPASSQHASSYDQALSVGPVNAHANYLPGVTLDRRVQVAGTVVSAAGDPIAGATVQARVGTQFKWSLPSAVQTLVDTLPLPTATTDDHGEFVIWLDPVIAGTAAVYELDLIPPAGARAPRWSSPPIKIKGTSGTQSVGSLVLPHASYARGVVRDPTGAPVTGAELRLYELGAEPNACAAANAPGGANCVPPAQLRGLWKSRDDAEVWMVLPKP